MKNVFIAILDDPDATVDLEGRSEDIKACVISIVARVLMVLDLTGKACYLQTNDLRRFVLFCDKRCPEMLGNMHIALHMPPSEAAQDAQYSYAGGQRLTTSFSTHLQPSTNKTEFSGVVWMGDWHILFESSVSASHLVAPAVQGKSAVLVSPIYTGGISIPRGSDRRPLPTSLLPTVYGLLMDKVRESVAAQQRAGTTLPRQPQNPHPVEALQADLVLLRPLDSYSQRHLHLSPSNGQSFHSTVRSGALEVHCLRSTDKAFNPEIHDVVGIGHNIITGGYNVAVRLIARQAQGKTTLTWPGGGNRSSYSPDTLERLQKMFEDVLQGMRTWCASCICQFTG